jgi:hypothetical protein
MQEIVSVVGAVNLGVALCICGTLGKGKGTLRNTHPGEFQHELPQGNQTKHRNSKDHVLKFEKNIYGQKQAGRV